MKHLTSLIVASVIAFLASAHDVVAFDPAQYQTVKDGKKDCSFCDLSAANLAKVDLAGANLESANLTGVDVTTVKNLDKCLCDWGTKLPAGWICSGVTIQRE